MADKLCPLMREPCIEHRCQWYMQVHFTDQHGEPKTDWGCAVQWLPQLIIHQVKETGHIGAAIESARNEARKDAMAVTAGLVGIAEAAREQLSPHRHYVPGNTIDANLPPPGPGLLRRLGARLFKGGS